MMDSYNSRSEKKKTGLIMVQKKKSFPDSQSVMFKK